MNSVLHPPSAHPEIPPSRKILFIAALAAAALLATPYLYIYDFTVLAVAVAFLLRMGLRDGFLSGQWNPTAMLLDRFDEVRAVADRLPYLRGF